jgi:hypothetical protein
MAKKRPPTHPPWINQEAVVKDLPARNRPPERRVKKAVDLEVRRRIIHARVMAFLPPYTEGKATEEGDQRWLERLREAEEKLPKRGD